MFFKSWQEKKRHDELLHNRFESVDRQQNNSVLEKEEKDYWICFIHAKKLDNNFECPVISCDGTVRGRKSAYLEELKHVKHE